MTSSYRAALTDKAQETQYHYEYDTYGNWIRRLGTFEGGESAVVRRITYYDE